MATGGPKTLIRHYRDILRRAGLPSDAKDLFHKIRKTTASYIKAAGGNPTDRLGHSSDQVTKAYLDPRIAQPPRAVNLLPRPIEADDNGETEEETE